MNRLERADNRHRDGILVPTQAEYEIARQRRVKLTGELIRELRAEAKRKRTVATTTNPALKPSAGIRAEPKAELATAAATITALQKQVAVLRKEAANAHYQYAKFKLEVMSRLLN